MTFRSGMNHEWMARNLHHPDKLDTHILHQGLPSWNFQKILVLDVDGFLLNWSHAFNTWLRKNHPQCHDSHPIYTIVNSQLVRCDEQFASPEHAASISPYKHRDFIRTHNSSVLDQASDLVWDFQLSSSFSNIPPIAGVYAQEWGRFFGSFLDNSKNLILCLSSALPPFGNCYDSYQNAADLAIGRIQNLSDAFELKEMPMANKSRFWSVVMRGPKAPFLQDLLDLTKSHITFVDDHLDNLSVNTVRHDQLLRYTPIYYHHDNVNGPLGANLAMLEFLQQYLI